MKHTAIRLWQLLLPSLFLPFFLTLFSLLLFSCNDETTTEPPVIEEPQEAVINLKLTIQSNTKSSSSRGGESLTAIGVVPEADDFLLLLLDANKNIRKAYSADGEIKTTGKKITVTKDILYIHVIGNIEQNKIRLLNATYTRTTSELAEYLSDNPGIHLSAIGYQIGNQGLETGNIDTSQNGKLSRAECVNVRGECDLSEYSDNEHAWLPDNTTITITVIPAVARIEIGSIKAIKGEDADYKIQKFTLENIFINNNFKYISADYVNYPDYPSGWTYPDSNDESWYTNDNLIAYNWNCDDDNYHYPSTKFFKAQRNDPINFSDYPLDFCLGSVDIGRLAIDNDPTKNPSVAPYNSKCWSFYVAPAWKDHPAYDDSKPTDKENFPYIGNAIWPYQGDKNAIVAKRKYFRATPVIIIKLSDFGPKNPQWYNTDDKLGWLTVTNFYESKSYDASDPEKSRIHRFLPGMVYRIEEVVFSDDHVNSQPVTENEGELHALVNVQDWTKVDVPNGNPLPME